MIHLGGIPQPISISMHHVDIDLKIASWNGAIIATIKFILHKVGLSLAVYSSTFFLGCAGNLLILLSVASHGQVNQTVHMWVY